MTDQFDPGFVLRNSHVQTIGSSLFVRTPRLPASQRLELECRDGIVLEAWHTPGPKGRVILVHGWLGSAESSYIKMSAAELLAEGYDIVRLNLRDHGNTAHLNEGMFNSARLGEVVDACRALAKQATALVGYSLGGNFALRVAAATGIPALAICPPVDPEASCQAIDNGSPVYRHYFLNKWRRALATKAAAYPDQYDFAQAMRYRSVLGLTEHFIGGLLPYASASDYFSAYKLDAALLANAPVEIIAARDDPVIPASGFAALNGKVDQTITQYGGHCGYVPRDWLASKLIGFADRTVASREPAS